LRPPRPTALALAGLALAAHAHASGGVEWPGATTSETEAADPLAPARWEVEMAWTTASPMRLEQLAERLAQQLRRTPDAATTLAARAVVLRALGRFDDARASLDRALARDPGVLADPDVALTHAYLLARGHRYAEAVAAARPAFARLGGRREAREELVLEVARWSMARGPEGLDDAIGLLRDLAALGPPAPMVRATLALALVRQGRIDEAREVARGGQLPAPYMGATQQRRGTVVPGEGDAAVGVALVLAGRGRDAVEPLARAAGTVPAPWRPGMADFLAQARRAAPAEPAPARGGVVGGAPCGVDLFGRPVRCRP
jgi:tetratricopeptide (TPR) repeat protein